MQRQLQKQLATFGGNLRDLRLRRGWTLEDLARQSGLSATFLSRLESGARQPSISVVLTLSNLFSTSISSLFESAVEAEPCVVVRSTEVAPQNSEGLSFIPLSNSQHGFSLKPLRVEVSAQRRGHEHYSHDGEEFIYVLSGKLTLSLGEKSYDLNPGDAAHFDSRVPHRLIARDQTEPEVLLVASPTTSQRSQLNPQSFSSARRVGPIRNESSVQANLFYPQQSPIINQPSE